MRFGDNFTGFTDKAINVFEHAQAAAVELGHTVIGSEHILYGLSFEDGGIAAKILNDAGLQSRFIFDLIVKQTGRSEHTDTLPQGYTPRAKHIANVAIAEANRRGYKLAGPEHLLLGLLRTYDSTAGRIIFKTGLDIDMLFTTLIDAIGSNVFRPIPINARMTSTDGIYKTET